MWKNDSENAEAIRIDRYVRNSELMNRLVRERYGDRALRLLAAIRRATAGLLVSLGLTAMLDYDRIFARRCYRLALHYDPFDAKTYVRLGVDFPAGARCADDIGGVAAENPARGFGAGACVNIEFCETPPGFHASWAAG